LEHQEALAQYAVTEHEAGSEHALPAEVLDCAGYGHTESQFRLHPTLPWSGLWAVSNEWKDVSDVASIKEQRSYRLLERPYRLPQAIDKKSVDQDALGVTAAVRKQVPVLLDFNEGRVYFESSDQKLIYAIVVRLQRSGAGIIPVAWTDRNPNWTAGILNRLYAGTQYQDEFVKRADEARRFKAKEIETLEGRDLESSVATFFSMTQLASDLGCAYPVPGRCRSTTRLPQSV
jgi:hypothetical protein